MSDWDSLEEPVAESETPIETHSWETEPSHPSTPSPATGEGHEVPGPDLHLIHPETWHRIQEFFCQSTGFSVTVRKPNGEYLCPPTLLSPSCRKILGGNNLPSCAEVCEKLQENAFQAVFERRETFRYRCHLGASNCAMPISINKRLIAVILAGQVLTFPLEEQEFREKLAEMDLPSGEIEEIWNLYRALPVLPEKRFDAHLHLLATMATAFAHENLQKEEERKRSRRFALVSEINQLIGGDLTRLLRMIAGRVAEVTEMERCTIFLADDQGQALVARASNVLSGEQLNDFRIPLGDTLSAASLMGQPFFSRDASRDPRLVKDFVNACGIRSLMTLPLQVGRKVIGILHLTDSTTSRAFTDEEINFSLALAAEIALAIESSRLAEERRKRIVELQESKVEIQSYFTQIGRALGSALNIQSLLHLIGDLSMRVTHTDACSLYLFRDGCIEREVVIGLPALPESGLVCPIDGGKRRIPKAVENLMQESPGGQGTFFSRDFFFMGEADVATVVESNLLEEEIHSRDSIASLLRIPLKVQDEIVGLLNVYSRTKREFATEEIEILRAFASQATLAIENVGLFEQTQEKAREIQDLYEAASAIGGKLSLKEILIETASRLCRMVEMDRCLVFLVDEQRKILKSQASFGVTPDEQEFFGTISVPMSFFEGPRWVEVRRGKPLLLTGSLEENAAALGDFSKIISPRCCLFVPLLSKQRLIGFLYLDARDSRPELSEEQLTRTMSLSIQGATAIERAQLYEQLTNNIQQMRLLYQISTTLSTTLNPDKIFPLIIEKASQLLNKGTGCLLLWDDAKKQYSIIAARGLSESFLSEIAVSPDDRIFEPAIIKRKPFIVTNLMLEVEDPHVAQKVKREGLGSMLSVPLISRKKTMGLLCFFDEVGHHYSQEDVSLLSNFASHATLCIENSRLYSILRNKVQELAALFEMGKTISASLRLQEVMQETSENLSRVMKADACAIMIKEHIREELSFQATFGLSKKFHHKKVSAQEGLVGRVLTTGHPMVVYEFQESSPFRFPRSIKEEGMRTMLMVPLSLKDEAIGVAAVYTKDVRHFTEADINLLCTLANQAAIAIENARRYEEQYSIAQIIQKNLLPRKEFSIPGLEIAHKYVPTREVSGDYFDVVQTAPGRWGLAIADVSGKGSQAALYAARGKYAWKAYALENHSPDLVISKLNRLLIPETPPEKFITMLYLIIDITKMELTFSSAGHEPALLYKSARGLMSSLHTDGMVLGVSDGAQYTKKRVKLGKGDLLILYTDGLSEARNKDGEIFGIRRLREIVTENADLSVGALANKIYNGVQRFARRQFLEDDLTLMVIRVK
ncbi:MAG: GAF domain-containing protein [Armatimonadetes bacterium]|nr:GAF domain-containing protein [Armatimonadota bacterium]